ncbi:helix-turn-helix domain-containing protein, partial [Nocardioides massiliensis]
RHELPEGRELRRPGAVDLFVEQVPQGGGVVPIARPGRAVEPIVIDDHAEPAPDPVIGPEITAARTRLGLSVDALAERTRIRPHVLESIEVDDFAPCGGDVYARGHLRTVARVLGMDADGLVATFDHRYAHAPIDARRVFEAELATGMTGSMRRTSGGPNWTALAAAVLSLALVWGVARVFTGDGGSVEVPSPSLNGSAGLTRADIAPIAPATPVVKPVQVVLTATADARVVVRDREGNVVFRGPLVLGERKRLSVPPPVRVRASVPGVVEISVRGRDRGLLGEPTAGTDPEPVTATYRR